jgi:hypothetical protein
MVLANPSLTFYERFVMMIHWIFFGRETDPAKKKFRCNLGLSRHFDCLA